MTLNELRPLAALFKEYIEDFEVRYDLAIDLAWKHHTGLEIEDPILYDRMVEIAREWLEESDFVDIDMEDYEQIDQILEDVQNIL